MSIDTAARRSSLPSGTIHYVTGGLAENQKKDENTEGEQLSRDWVLDNFRLRDNSIIKANPEVGEELIKVLQ